MSIADFIQSSILLPRLQKACALVVYDADRRYHALCMALASDTLLVVDASESSIESREAALAALQRISEPGSTAQSLLVYVPVRAPLDDEARQRDPFALYAACGAIFPDPANDGETFESLCLRARPDHVTAIRRVFQNDANPSFAVIDAVGGGTGWPNLQAVLGVESAREILGALLAPDERQRASLKGHDAWVAEAKELLQGSIGLRLLTKAKSWEPIADELWRFLLFSEFVFDLPAELPATLSNVPRALPEARPLIEDLCERLRDNRRTQALYIERAETIERDLGLIEACRAIADLGVRDTFPFEERSFFAQAVDALKRDNVDRLRGLLGRHAQSVWVGRGENQAEWQLLQAAARLIEACEDADRQLPEHSRSQASLIDFYLASLREVDRLQRELEQAAGDNVGADGQLTDVISQARTSYQRLSNRVQGLFLRHLEKAGWPPEGRLANADVFDKLVAPQLQASGRRVALLLIDALRYELGVELQRQLAEGTPTELQAAFAQLPSVTPVGMASLLPGAGQHLRLAHKSDEFVPTLGDQPLANVNQRMDVLRNRYGQRFHEVGLSEFVRAKHTVAATVELLVIRSNEMDSDFEHNPEAAPGLISRTFQRIAAAVHKLRGMGFQEALIVTDHGFYLNTAAEAGDVCIKPAGKWINLHERMLLGDGTGDSANIVLPAAHLGIKGNVNQVALPRAMVAYRAGQWYFHGGASLQEAVVPVISVRLQPLEQQLSKGPSITLRYKRGAKRITTRLPVVEIEAGQGDLFSTGAAVEILVEAHDRKGNVVGEVRPGPAVNPATKTVTVKPGETVQVTLKMSMEYDGKLIIKALDPATLATYHTLELETDYTV